MVQLKVLQLSQSYDPPLPTVCSSSFEAPEFHIKKTINVALQWILKAFYIDLSGNVSNTALLTNPHERIR